MATDRVVLSSYDAKRCARRVHNEWGTTIDKGSRDRDVPDELQMRIDQGREYEREVLQRLRVALGERLVQVPPRAPWAERVDLTVAAMQDGAEVITGGSLPDDEAGARSGRPDLLLRWPGNGDPAYVPADVKAHRIAKESKRGLLTWASLEGPVDLNSEEGFAVQHGQRLDDYLQLAHYWRMLEALGRTPSGVAPTAAIIGTDSIHDAPAFVWLDLASPLFTTFSRSKGRKKRSALERYDHEHGFRVKVAETAAARSGEADDPEPLVGPVFTEECDTCPWYEHCRDLVDPDLASLVITSGRLSVREWTALATLGVTTLVDLADLTLADDFANKYLTEVSNVRQPIARLEAARRRARMHRDGRLLERESLGPVPVPRADVEIDVDIEWDLDNRVYLWGALVSRPGREPQYVATVDWNDLDDDSEKALAKSFAEWLRRQVADADHRGESLLVFHYSHPERTYLISLLGVDAVADVLEHYVDLLTIVREHFFGRDGLGIKKVAPAFGFGWRDEDPGGLQSQLWLEQARAAVGIDASEGRDRILRYNEDDVRATLAVREGLGRT